MTPACRGLGLLALCVLPSLASAAQGQDPGLGQQTAAPDEQDAATLLAEIKKGVDDADPDLVRRLAELKTEEALKDLFEVYDYVGSIYMREIVLDALRTFDGVPRLARLALQRLADVATDSPERELREHAVDVLGNCPEQGPAFLALIVESSADDAIRERAMEQHVRVARDGQLDWYRRIWKGGDDEEQDATQHGRGDDPKVPRRLPEVRRMAFAALAPHLTKDELIGALDDHDRAIRLQALEQLASRGEPEALDRAEKLYDDVRALPADRLAAAHVLADARGAEMADTFLKDGGRVSTPEELVFGLADIVADMRDPGVQKEILHLAGKGKGSKLIFSIRAARKIDDPRLEHTLVRLLGDKDPTVQSEVIRVLVERRSRDAVSELEKLIEHDDHPLVVRDAVLAVTDLRGDDPEWTKRLIEMAGSAQVDTRNAAIETIGKTKNPDHLDLLVQSLQSDQWSTRLAAARALEDMRLPAAVGAIALQMEHESGRMAVELSKILWRLTGKSFHGDGKLWARWWKDHGDGFQIVSEEELQAREKEQRLRELRQTTRTPAQFFGIRIVSHGVTFVLDVSGSMADPTRGRFRDEKGDPRIEVAKQQLKGALEGLDKSSFFNLIVFSNAATSWQDGVVQLSPDTLAKAEEYVDRLGALGGTNLYGALRLAFDNPSVDTIFLLSDGEPSVGDVIDPFAIRREVDRWRRTRDVVINAIAIGGKLQLLKELADDTGGQYVYIP